MSHTFILPKDDVAFTSLTTFYFKAYRTENLKISTESRAIRRDGEKTSESSPKFAHSLVDLSVYGGKVKLFCLILLFLCLFFFLSILIFFISLLLDV